MEVKLLREPKLQNPVLICGWSGIGNIGLIAADTLRTKVGAEELGEIESWNFFYPQRVKVNEGLLVDLDFPANRFYFKKREKADLLFFIGQEQPLGDDKAYRIGEGVLDVAIRLGCQRIYTSGAAVSSIHHHMKPRVWAVPNKKDLISEVRQHDNTILMSDIEGSADQGYITGLNGLLIGMAQEKGIEAVCLMGEFPVYISQSIAYPRASLSVLEVLTKIIGIEVNLSHLEEWGKKIERNIEELYQQIPDDMKKQIEKFKYTKPVHFTEEDGKRLVEEVEEFLRRNKDDG